MLYLMLYVPSLTIWTAWTLTAVRFWVDSIHECVGSRAYWQWTRVVPMEVHGTSMMRKLVKHDVTMLSRNYRLDSTRTLAQRLPSHSTVTALVAFYPVLNTKALAVGVLLSAIHTLQADFKNSNVACLHYQTTPILSSQLTLVKWLRCTGTPHRNLIRVWSPRTRT